MAFVGSINLDGGETFNDGIEYYLQIQSEDLTRKQTVLNLNDIEYPIGYFNKDNIELFKLGMLTIKNMGYLIDRGLDIDSDQYKKHADYFIEEAFKAKFDNPYDCEEVLEAFSNVADDMKITLFDGEQWIKISEERDKKIEEVHNASITK